MFQAGYPVSSQEHRPDKRSGTWPDIRPYYIRSIPNIYRANAKVLLAVDLPLAVKELVQD